MMAVKLLVNIAVMMMAPGGTPVPPEARGREPLRDWIYLAVSLWLCILSWLCFTVSYIYMEIRNSDWPETFVVIIFLNISFLAAKEERQLPYGGLTRVGGAPRGAGAPPTS